MKNFRSKPPNPPIKTLHVSLLPRAGSFRQFPSTRLSIVLSGLSAPLMPLNSSFFTAGHDSRVD